MAHAGTHALELHAIVDGELPAARVAEILPGLLEDPRNADLLVALERQRRDLLDLREALDASWPPQPPSAAEVELCELVQRERRLDAALAGLGTAALPPCVGREAQRVRH